LQNALAKRMDPRVEPAGDARVWVSVERSGHRFSEKITHRGEPGSVAFAVTLRRERSEPRRATARIPLRVGGRSSFEARALAGHLRMTDNDR